jgi:hypothetical protein
MCIIIIYAGRTAQSTAQVFIMPPRLHYEWGNTTLWLGWFDALRFSQPIAECRAVMIIGPVDTPGHLNAICLVYTDPLLTSFRHETGVNIIFQPKCISTKPTTPVGFGKIARPGRPLIEGCTAGWLFQLPLLTPHVLHLHSGTGQCNAWCEFSCTGRRGFRVVQWAVYIFSCSN